jgi:uroporphyrinogen decarboxylase
MSKAKQKIERLRSALSHQQGDRVPVGDFFWTGFLLKCKEKWGEDFDPYKHFDLDYIVITPNMDPHIKPFEIIEQNGYDIIIKTGFEAVIKRSGIAPMPHYDSFSIETPAEMAKFVFDNPADSKRFFEGGDDQINCVGDALSRNLPAWDQRLGGYIDDFAVFGSVCEPYEFLWRIIGTENALCWMVEEPELYQDFVNRIAAFLLDFCKAQIKAGKGRLSGMYIWGDVAYRNGMLFNPNTWRKVFKPHVKALIDLCHANGLMVVYHGCGNATPIYNDFVEMGLDAYNPLEAKADLDVVVLKQKYAEKLAFVGNVDVRVLERGNPDEIKQQVLYKLQAAENGGWIFQSDHSVSSEVAPESYQRAIEILREYGNYPLDMDRIQKELQRLDK